MVWVKSIAFQQWCEFNQFIWTTDSGEKNVNPETTLYHVKVFTSPSSKTWSYHIDAEDDIFDYKYFVEDNDNINELCTLEISYDELKSLISIKHYIESLVIDSVRNLEFQKFPKYCYNNTDNTTFNNLNNYLD